MKLLEKKVKSLLEEHLYIPEEFTHKKSDLDYILKRYREDIEDVLDDLNGTLPKKMELNPLPIVNDKFILKIWSTLDFNRYRLKTLRAEFYNQITWFQLDLFRLSCRNQEKECLKTGASGKNWTSKEDEIIFGTSEDPGDLGLNGSATWKTNAFKSFIEDLLLFHQNKPVVILSIYDKLMVNGSLITVEKLLLEYPKDFDTYFWQFLSRKINNALLNT